MKWMVMALPLLLAACGKDEEKKAGGMMHGPSAVAGDRTKDPVCKMDVDRATAKKVTHEGVNYYFCADDCVAKFKADPKKYVLSCLCAKSSKKCPCEHCGGDSPCDCAK